MKANKYTLDTAEKSSQNFIAHSNSLKDPLAVIDDETRKEKNEVGQIIYKDQ